MKKGLALAKKFCGEMPVDVGRVLTRRRDLFKVCGFARVWQYSRVKTRLRLLRLFTNF